MAGPLAGLRIIEIAALGPAPFAATMLADHGAEVIRVARPGGVQAGQRADASRDVLGRSRTPITVDLKPAEGKAIVRDLCRSAHGVIEGFRPGVMERLGLGPDVLLADNPALVYGRMTGWGQAGPLAPVAGHDINYIALSGVLDTLGRRGDKPTAPLNLVGDYGGGGMMLAFGMLAGLLHAQRTGEGQVVDCAMVDGAAMLGAVLWTFEAQGRWNPERGTNLLDTGAHHYDTYACADGKHVAIGPIEPQFYAILRDKTGFAADPDFDRQNDPAAWPALKAKLTERFLTKTRDQWCALLEGTDACFAPVLTPKEAPLHPHNAARGNFVTVDGIEQPAPAPRYSRTITDTPRMPTPAMPGDGEALLRSLGYDDARIGHLRAAGALG